MNEWFGWPFSFVLMFLRVVDDDDAAAAVVKVIGIMTVQDTSCFCIRVMCRRRRRGDRRNH